MSRRRRSRPERCQDWPCCGCGRRWDYFTEALPALCLGPPLTDEQLDDVHFQLIYMLACMAQHCPDASKRQHATLQLMRPIFAGEARRWLN